METKVYVDVLLVLNYIINTLLLACTAKLTGRRLARRRMVAAALLGSVSALTIFLPFLGFAAELLLKLALAAVIVMAAFPYRGPRPFAKLLFVFFAVSFLFAGVMLGLWFLLRPSGMLYYNGVVYFHISSAVLIVTAVLAYVVLTVVHRFTRNGRVRVAVYTVEIRQGGSAVCLRGLVDSGNSLTEPFSGSPVMVCALRDLAALLPPAFVQAVAQGDLQGAADCGLAVRMIPCGTIGGSGLLPAFRPEGVTLAGEDGRFAVEDVYIAVTTAKIGGAGFELLLSPDLVRLHI